MQTWCNMCPKMAKLIYMNKKNDFRRAQGVRVGAPSVLINSMQVMRLLSNQSTEDTGSKIFLGILSFTPFSSSSPSLPPIFPILEAGGDMWRTIHMYNIWPCFLRPSVSDLFMHHNWLSDGRAKFHWGNEEWIWGEMEESASFRNLWSRKTALTLSWGWGFAVPCGDCRQEWLAFSWDLPSSSWNSAGSFIS